MNVPKSAKYATLALLAALVVSGGLRLPSTSSDIAPGMFSMQPEAIVRIVSMQRVYPDWWSEELNDQLLYEAAAFALSITEAYEENHPTLEETQA